MSVRGQERLDIITEFIKTGSCRDGYKVIETKTGGYMVRKAVSPEEQLTKQKEKLLKKLEQIEIKLKSKEVHHEDQAE